MTHITLYPCPCSRTDKAQIHGKMEGPYNSLASAYQGGANGGEQIDPAHGGMAHGTSEGVGIISLYIRNAVIFAVLAIHIIIAMSIYGGQKNRKTSIFVVLGIALAVSLCMAGYDAYKVKQG